ncbi:MAG: excinuclease ABC subunit UvrC, partial [Chloroflexi bacterium]|nr:excinuclease ABC subunit UvrC [Chloroflexota bacterium]
MELPQIQERIRALPLAPGVYLFKDSRGRTIYVGKAARLRNRVRSYFGSKARFTPKVSRLVEHIVDFEFFVTASEEEALILELNFIKKFRPRYNISLKDDKSFPFLKIDPADGFPRVVITRRMTKDGGRYFGPFASAGSVRIVLQLIKRIFPLRSCTKPITGVDSRACLDYHIGRCVGPCIGAVDRAGYGALARQVTLFLEGRLDAVLRELRSDMASAARDLQYERAAMLRDQIRAVERVIGEQRIATTVRGDQDVIAFVKAGDLSGVQVFFIRHGRLTGRERFTMEGTRHEAPAQVVASFIKQFYSASTSVPPLFLLQHMPEDSRTIRQWLSGKRGGAVRFLAPLRGARKRLVDMVYENARQEQEQRRVQDLSDPQTTTRALEEVKEVLRL